jgi:hypothetical protein
MINTIYAALAGSIAAIVNQDNQPLFAHIDLWNRNVEFIQEEPPFDLPACFVEFAPLQYNQQRGGVQDAVLQVRLHIVTRWDTPTLHGGAYFDDAIAYLALPHIVYCALHACNIGGNMYHRTGSVINHDHGPVVDSVETYETSVTITKQATNDTIVPGISVAAQMDTPPAPASGIGYDQIQYGLEVARG